MRVSLEGENGNELWANIFHVLAVPSGSPTEANIGDLVNNIYTSFVDRLVPLMNNGADIEQGFGSWSKGDGTFVEGSYANLVVGADSGIPLDAATCMLLSWRVSAAWRGGHPRTYLAGISADRLDNAASYTTTTVSDYQAAAELFLSDVNSIANATWDSVTLGCLRSISGGVELDPQVFVPFGSVLARKRPATQRRRLVG